MTPSIARIDAVQATVFTTLGALLLFDALSFPLGASLVAVALLVVAVLVLVSVVRGPVWLGVGLFATAMLTLVDNPVGRFLNDLLVANLHTVAGGLLVVLGVLRLTAPPLFVRTRPDEFAEAT